MVRPVEKMDSISKYYTFSSLIVIEDSSFLSAISNCSLCSLFITVQIEPGLGRFLVHSTGELNVKNIQNERSVDNHVCSMMRACA